MTFMFTMTSSETKTLKLSLEIEGSEYISNFPFMFHTAEKAQIKLAIAA